MVKKLFLKPGAGNSLLIFFRRLFTSCHATKNTCRTTKMNMDALRMKHLLLSNRIFLTSHLLIYGRQSLPGCCAKNTHRQISSFPLSGSFPPTTSISHFHSNTKVLFVPWAAPLGQALSNG